MKRLPKQSRGMWFFDVSIYGARMNSIGEFATVMALQEIANTVEAAAAKANDASTND